MKVISGSSIYTGSHSTGSQGEIPARLRLKPESRADLAVFRLGVSHQIYPTRSIHDHIYNVRTRSLLEFGNVIRRQSDSNSWRFVVTLVTLELWLWTIECYSSYSVLTRNWPLRRARTGNGIREQISQNHFQISTRHAPLLIAHKIISSYWL